ncbi:MAG: AtpZ/AtpI family protein [Phycisphaera sp.]|nr:MAG: AtpZ/AtpI family protein [Phycisphaera sp.]
MSDEPPSPAEKRTTPPEADDPRLAIPEVLRDAPKPVEAGPDSRSKSGFGETAKAWGMGLDLVFTTIGGFAVGWGIDWWQGTGPWGAIIGLGLGFILATVRLIRYTVKAEARERAEREGKHKPPGAK